MNIIKNWFYKLSEILNNDEENNSIIINDNLVVAMFDDLWIPDNFSLFQRKRPEGSTLGVSPQGEGLINIKIWEKSRVEFYWILDNTGDKTINFIQNKELSNLSVRYLLLSKNNERIKVKICSEISASNSKSDIHILSIIWNDWFVDLDGIIKINELIEKVDAKLLEENLFLWDTWKVKWIPTLLVRSNDVKASHACRIERISDEKLFYLRSRWIWRYNALYMMIESYISSMFMCISMMDEKFYTELFENIIKKIK